MIWKGFAAGFVFGTLGLGLLAMLALALRVFEYIGAVFFAPGRFAASLLTGSAAGDGTVALLFFFSGLFYGVLGAAIELAANHLRR